MKIQLKQPQITKFLNFRENTNYLQKELARSNSGLTENMNPTGLNVDRIYPPMMHRVFNTIVSLCLRIDHVGTVPLKDRNKRLPSIKNVAREVETEKHCIKFDELGVKSLFDNFESLLKSSNFEGLIHEVLSVFISHLKPILPEIMDMDRSWSRYSYAIKICSVLECGVVFIFGSRKVTATMKQLIAYTDYYVQKALDDAELIGLPCSLGNFSDSVMEGLH